MDIKQRLAMLEGALTAREGFVSQDVDVVRAAIKEIERMEEEIERLEERNAGTMSAFARLRSAIDSTGKLSGMLQEQLARRPP